jgi:hypothetical protein
MNEFFGQSVLFCRQCAVSVSPLHNLTVTHPTGLERAPYIERKCGNLPMPLHISIGDHDRVDGTTLQFFHDSYSILADL